MCKIFDQHNFEEKKCYNSVFVFLPNQKKKKKVNTNFDDQITST